MAFATDGPVLPAELTLDGALDLFRQQGLDLLIAEATVGSARGDLEIARQIYNPGASYGYSRILNYVPSQVCPPDGTGAGGSASCSPNVHAFGLSDNAALSDILSGKRGLRVDVASSALEAARLSRDDARRNLEFQLKSQYMQAVLARDQLDFALEVQHGWEQTLDLVRLRHKIGEISEVDEARVETEKLESDQAVLAARQTLRAAKAAVAFLLGVRGDEQPFEVVADLPKYAVPAALVDATVPALMKQALEQRPDLKAQSAQVARATAALASAKRARFPDLSLNLGFSYAAPGGGAFSSNTVPPTPSIGVSGNLPIFYQQGGEISKAEADQRTQAALYEKSRAQITAEVITAWGSFASARDQVQRMEGRLLDRATVARDLTQIQYQKGAASLLEYLDAERTFIGTKGEYLQDLAGYWIAVFQVEQAIGASVR